jgi:hypothetical protein
MAYTNREAQERELAFSALSLMRREHLSLREAAGKLDISPRLVLRYVRDALRRGVGGNYYAKRVDNLSRPLKFLTEDGIVVIDVRDSRDATLVSDYMRALRNYLYTGRESFLAPFRGKRVGPYRFVTNPDTIDRLADDELEFDSIYNFVVGGRA